MTKDLTRANEYIPDRFRREIILHLFKNLDPAPAAGVPLILGIHGPSGEGKTYQCARVLGDLGASVEFISGGELENVDAGEPASLIRRKYAACGAGRRSSPTGVAALVFNDIDAAIGDWGERVQYTVNRQNVFGEIMHLADFPNVIEGERVARIPVIITGNDFTKLHGPVVRPGRMRSFSWVPSPVEKAAVLARTIADLPESDWLPLVSRFPAQPVAFFVQVHNELLDDALWAVIIEHGERQVFTRLARGERPRLPRHATRELFSGACERALSNNTLVNHLGG